MIPRRHSSTTFRVARLDDGLRVATAEMPHMASVSLGIWAGVGARYETASQNGISHFIEHMLFKGTRRRNALQISQAIEGCGGALNAFTAEENTCFFARASARHFPDLLDVLADMYLEPAFHPEDIRNERAVIKEEVAQYFDDPQQYVLELLNATQWPNHPLGRPITGTLDSLDRVGRRDLLGFFRTRYVNRNTLICAAGRISHTQVIRRVKPLAPLFRKGPQPVHTPAALRDGGAPLALQPRDIEQTNLALGIRTCSRHDERRFALRLLNVVLGENMSSRLFQRLREDLGLVYFIQSSLTFFDDTGDIVVSAGTDERQLEQVLVLMLRELADLAVHGVTRRELRHARDYVVGQIELSLESAETQMMALAEQLLGWGRVMPPARIKDRLATLTPAVLRAAAADFFRPDRFSLALVGPLNNAGRWRRFFQQAARVCRR